jgi:hypothetical protein
MFALGLQHFRTSGAIQGTLLDGLCGEASNLSALQLDTSVDSIYLQFVEAFSMSLKERETLRHFFYSLTAKAARNAVHLSTRSPFQLYYEALLRQATRGSTRHLQLREQLALALGRPLERDMDRWIQDQVSPEVVALFPLTACLNHACAPKAQIVSSFCDFHMDLVACEDIQVGEQVTISYLPWGRGYGQKSRAARQRELYAKYLFHCNCSECCK